MWQTVKNKTNEARIAKTEGEIIEERKDTKREEKGVQKTNNRGRDRDSQNNRRKTGRGERFDRDQNSREDSFQKIL